jgi:hypothetical protein
VGAGQDPTILHEKKRIDEHQESLGESNRDSLERAQDL